MTTRSEYEARRDRWADALESGEYEQGSELLCVKDHYCCLGVACEIFEEEAGLTRELSVEDEFVRWDGRPGVAPSGLVKFLGLHAAAGENIQGTTSLASLNDDGTPFKEIARLLREEPENWFTWAQEDEG